MTTEFLEPLAYIDPFDVPLFDPLSPPTFSEYSSLQQPSSNSIESVSLELDLSTYLLNRSQWYQIQCKFTSPEGYPAFVGRTVIIDPSVAFLDSRKRFSVSKGDNDINPPLILYVLGVCSLTGRTLLKCKKCKDQDKVKINRKRKRDSEGWSDIDQDNNSKLFQVLETGCHKVGEDGTLLLRFRVQCCVGASRQFHRNHMNNENQNNTYENSNEEVHKGCEGFSLATIVKVGLSEIYQVMKDPIRVVGKVTKMGTKTTSSTHQPMSQLGHPLVGSLTVYTIPNISPTQINTTQVLSTTDPTPVNQFQTQMSPPLNINCYSETKPNADNGWHIYQLFSILRKNLNDSSSLRKIALTYLTRVDSRFQFSCRTLFDRDFFHLSNLLQIPRESALMLQVYHCLSVGYIIRKNGYGKKKDRLFSLTEELAFQLTMKAPIMHMPDNELFYLADTFNRISVSQIITGKISNGKYFMNEASKLYNQLLCSQPHIKSTSSYELLMWNKSCFHMQPDHLQQAYEWAHTFSRPKLLVRVLCLMIVLVLYPDLEFEKFTSKNGAICGTLNGQFGPCGIYPNPLSMGNTLSGPFKTVPPPLETSKKENILSLCNLLEIALDMECNLDMPKDPLTGSVISTPTSVSKVMHLTVSALRHWINSDIAAATAAMEDCALHASAAKTQEHDMAPIDMAAFVAVQLMGLYLGMDDTERGSGTESQSHEEEGTEDGWMGERGRSWEEKRSRSILIVEIFLKFQMSRSPWGMILDWFNVSVFQNLMKGYRSVYDGK